MGLRNLKVVHPRYGPINDAIRAVEVLSNDVDVEHHLVAASGDEQARVAGPHGAALAVAEVELERAILRGGEDQAGSVGRGARIHHNLSGAQVVELQPEFERESAGAHVVLVQSQTTAPSAGGGRNGVLW